ncbi:PTS system beta-glucoside-specific IIA component, Glc family (TC 4.A.1.2.11)/PTS system beta-glucoside-specific IIB component, Glc family (TC 4.A.1.2.11)/PTS system beta-glucoside-specific IIC component, Glc family (TC 4.A.1.2.11) [Gracilibacillus ureilyticus]|uniref:PTS system, beta-glucosides-specific IIC component n=1 Tax=Gracilibacillus ureilyticus TaxID=531814 RepID=A0A1H9U0J4_9BACI|nr:beta-glucoside-specific PTS transporter subunit IIABC [Gracilibacillus ureilyticus]SES02687.1 PTS system beta-glucoside-specific IIA component, Glc family (TC 4.A.1.2.11)/PTS system beta-glucoside-specific IIB component, Glc family (TC 4.A.1.2.11)/PTS system beta-glucoside-specific IIC component, Glc family (TC 4.A.1.2.11) [Gracilibacillus ureilyticus]
MDYQKTASAILQYVGGQDNVVHLGHCATRLRFTLHNDNKVETKDLMKIEGVLKIVKSGGQTQVVIGSDVVEVYEQLMKMGNFGSANSNEKPKGKRKIGATVLDFIVSVFQPLIPAMAGAGILKSILFLLTALNVLSEQDHVYLILRYISDSVYYFLPILVAITVANKLKVNPIVAAAAMSILLFPNMTTLMGEGATFLTFDITNVNYSSQLFPSILGVIFYSYMEKFFTKVSPKAVRVFFIPMMSLLLTVPFTLIVLGPIGFTLGVWFTNLILFLFNNVGWVAVGLLATSLPFMVATGMHKATTPYAVSSLSSLGKEALMLPALLAHNMSESGASLAVALRSKDTQQKSVALSGGISAFFGITEPALYGITLQNKRVLGTVITSSLIGGLFVGFFGLAGFTLVTPGIASISMFIDPDNGMNIIYALIGLVISFITSFVLTFFFWKATDRKEENIDLVETEKADKTSETSVITDQNNEITINNKIKLYQPVSGAVIPITEVNDDVFSSKAMGEGIAVIPDAGQLVAPADGTIKMVFNTNHALGMETEDGVELLFHIGIDTVQLDGKYFESHVKEGDEVKTGDLLVTFETDKIVEAGFDTTTMIVITNQK